MIRPAFLLFLLTFFVFVPTLRADPCMDCEKQYRRSCAENCERSANKDEYEKCRSTCVENVCKKTCELSPSNVHFNTKFKSECERCLFRAEGSGCSDTCSQGSEGFGACLKKCAKNKCVDECDLPAVEAEEDDLRVSDKDCRECRDTAFERCRSNDDCIAGEPGFKACRMACAVKQCSSICDHF